MSATWIILGTFFISTTAFAAGKSNLLGVSQGISSPTSTSTINYTNGFTTENPVGVLYQEKIRATGQIDLGDDSGDGLGGELGIGNGQFGAAVGYYSRDCNNCDGNFSGAVAGSISDVALGIRFGEDIYSAGMVFNFRGKHRFGLMADFRDPDGDDNGVTALGAGYSYVDNQVTFSLDASKLDFENRLANDGALLITPGVSFRFDMVAVSVSYDMYTNEPANSTYDNDLWFGVGLGKADRWHAAVYFDYVNEFSAAASFYF